MNKQASGKGKLYQGRSRWNFRSTWPLHLMVLVPFIFIIIFHYLPMMGLVIAFQDYKPWLGLFKSPFIGLDNFKMLFSYPESKQVIVNTLVIAVSKLVFKLITPFIFAIFLNEIRMALFKRTVQTLVYLPHFLSWVILGASFWIFFQYRAEP